MNFLHARIPIGFVLIAIAVSSAATALVVKSHVKVIERVAAQGSCDVQLVRNGQYKLTKPLIMVDIPNESPVYASLKGNIMSYLDDQKQKGQIRSAAVYFRDLNTGQWFSINEGESYSPGSIMKLVTLECILKQAEANPGLLNKQILLKRHFSELPEQTLFSKPMETGKSYSVRQLLESMIIHSNNDATALLNREVDPKVFKSLFESLQLRVPDMKDWDYQVNVFEVSKFMRVLYSSTFLFPSSSEFALDLLSRSDFKIGLVKELPNDQLVAHKFGERFNEGDQQLHETAIVYIGSSPFLLTVMTKGLDRTKLPDVLSTVGQMVQSTRGNS